MPLNLLNLIYCIFHIVQIINIEDIDYIIKGALEVFLSVYQILLFSKAADSNKKCDQIALPIL